MFTKDVIAFCIHAQPTSTTSTTHYVVYLFPLLHPSLL